MMIHVKVIAGAKKNLYRKDSTGIKIYLTAPAVEDKANEALVDFLADFYAVRPRHVMIVKGLKSRQKVINIEGL